MGKRFYIVLFSALFISVLLLGFSFSKESGSNDITLMNVENSEEFKVVYSNAQRLGTKENNSTEISIVNKGSQEQTFYLYLEEVDGLKYNDVTYSLNGSSEEILKNGIIKLGTLRAYGTDDDYGIFTVTLNSASNLTFKIEVKNVGKNDLGSRIVESTDVYTDSSDVLRYYGENPSNYIKYNNEVYRIVSAYNGKVKIVSEATVLGIYNPLNDNYVTTEDYLRSFNKEENVTLDTVLNAKGWMCDGKDFWLLESDENYAYYASLDDGVSSNTKLANYYIRTVVELDSELEVTNGDGTILSPYEVTYGSK